MTPFCKPAPFSCPNYDNDTTPAVEILKSPDGHTIDMTTDTVVIIFVTLGQIVLRYEDVPGNEMGQGQAMLFATGTKMRITMQKDSSVFILRIRKKIQLCDDYSLEKLFRQTDMTRTGHTRLPINNKIMQYLENFMECVGDGQRCSHYFDIKTAELFFLFRGYYTADELSGFFFPLLSPDLSFSDFVWQNYRRAKSVKELATLSPYGLSTFKARFRKTFGIAALRWMNEQKKRNVYHELTYSDKTLKQISAEYHFSSASHLTTFCKEKFGATPGQIRRSGAR